MTKSTVLCVVDSFRKGGWGRGEPKLFENIERYIESETIETDGVLYGMNVFKATLLDGLRFSHSISFSKIVIYN